MTFTSFEFFLYLAPAIFLAYVSPARYKAHTVLVLSYLFYFTWSVKYALLLASLTCCAYFVALAVESVSFRARRKLILLCCLGSFLAVFIIFKYSVLLSVIFRQTAEVLMADSVLSIVAPIGISYYLFKLISYVLDVYWGTTPAERNFVFVALYASWLPQILSGPIQRAPDFFNQIRCNNFGRYDPSAVDKAVGLLLLGFFEKLVVADRIGLFVGAADAQATAVAATRVLGTYAFAFQLFADFSGLTHIAIGLGLLFGIEGPPNFNRPFAASNIQEYWRRWHMSLTTWLGDYLFTPLRMSLRNYGDAGLAVSIMINMVLIGMWHGPDATFFVFGIIHGVFMIGSTLTLRKRNAFFKTHPTCAALRRFYAPVITFNMVCLGLHFFRAPSLSTAVNRFWGSTVPSLDLMTSPSFAREIWLPALLAAVVALELGSGVLGSQRLADAINSAKQEIVRWVVYSAVLMAIFLLTPESGGAFIYAKF